MMGFLGQALLYIVPFLLVLTTIVTVHELGHFLMARAFGVKIDTFSIGFGRGVLSRIDKRGTEWRLGWLPLGGYVRFAGDLDPSSVPDQAGLDKLKARLIADGGAGAERDYFHFKPVWQRALVVAAGPAANFVLSITLLSLLFGLLGQPVVPARVESVAAGSPAAVSGFRSGDLITSVNGRQIRDSQEVTRIVTLSAGTPLTFVVERAGAPVRLTATPARVEEIDEVAGRVRVGRIGLALRPEPGEIRYERYNPVQAVGKGVEMTGDVLGTTLTYLGRIATGKESGDMLSGPLGIAKATGGVTKQAATVSTEPALVAVSVLLTLVQLAAIISIGIGFLNLLPIPVLDGGHLLFYAYEAVARRPVPARVQEVGYRVGLALLAGLMLFATWNDLQKLSLFKFLGGLA